MNMRKWAHWRAPLALALLAAVAGAGCTAKMKAAYHEHRADKYFNAGQLAQAEIEYKNVLRDAPQNAGAWSRLGIIYYDQGRFLEAVQILNRAQQLATNNLEVRLKLATIYVGLGDLKKGWEQADFVLTRDPRDPQAPILLAEAAATNQISETRRRLQKLAQGGPTAPLDDALGTLALRQHDLPAAERLFNSAVKLDPQSSDAYSGLANLYLAQKDLKRADAALKKAADLAPPRSGKTLQYARFKMVSGDPAAARQLLESMVKRMPDYLPAWITLAELDESRKDYAQGLSLLGNVLSRDPENLDGLMLKGRLELELGRTADAINDYQTASKIFPKLPLVYYQLALAQLANHDPDKAVASLNQALALDPGYPGAVLAMANIQIRKGNADLAIPSLKKLIQRQPQLAAARLLLAEAYRAQGNLDSAVQIYRELEKTYPDNPQVPLVLGATLLQQQNQSGARAQFETAIKLAPDNLAAVEQLVNLDLQEKRFAEAQRRVQEQIGSHPKSAAPQVLLAKVMAAEGRTNQAEAALSKAITLQPGSPLPHLLLAQLYEASHQGQKALGELQTTLEKDPTNAPALAMMGMIYNARGNYPAAATAYRKLVAMAPDSTVALNNLACLDAGPLNNLAEAYQLARKARNLQPADPAIADTLGWILCRQKQYSAALGPLQEAAAKMEDNPEVQFHLGMTHYLMGDATDAQAAFQRARQLGGDFPEKDECNQCLAVLAVRVDTANAAARAMLEKRVAGHPDDLIALLRLAAIDQRSGDTGKAMHAYEAALQLDAQNVGAMINLARLYAPTDLRKAYNLAKSANRLAPTDPGVTLTYGRLTYLTGHYQWAYNLLRQGVQQGQASNPVALFDLAKAAYSLGKVAEAQTDMQNALQANPAFAQAAEAKRFLNLVALAQNPAQAVAQAAQVKAILKSEPNDVPALMVQAAIDGQKSDASAAEAAYQTVLNHYPDFAPAQARLAVLYLADPARNKQAYALANKARQTLPNDPEVAKVLGIVVYRTAASSADLSRAATLLQESAGQLAKDPMVHFYLGMAQYRLKHSAEARAALRKALALGLAGQSAAEAQKTLATLK